MTRVTAGKISALCLVVALVAAEQVAWRSEPGRQFIPGPLGNVTAAAAFTLGDAQAPAHRLAATAYRTRAMSGIERVEGGQEWAAFNGLTPSPNFSHHLAQIFPRGLFATHPEFFPLVDGHRLQPPAGSGFWNPDLGRDDVAAFAAAAARSFFTANPESDSFAVGVNDGLLFGESPETLAAITHDGARGRRAQPQTPNSKPIAQEITDNHASGVRYFRGRPDFSNLIFGFTNRVAEHLFGKAEPPPSTDHRLPSTDRPPFSPLPPVKKNSDSGSRRSGSGETDDAGKPHPHSSASSDFSISAFSVSAFSAPPDRYIGALAYYWAEQAPDFPLHPNVMPFLTADRSQGYDRAARDEEYALQRRWAERAAPAPLLVNGEWVGQETGQDANTPYRTDNRPRPTGNAFPSPPRRLGLYDYLYGYGFLIPRIHPALIAENLRQARRLGFTDYYAEIYPNWGLDGPMPWLVTQLLQDPEQSPEGLLDEYYRRYFGRAAVPMRRFFARCERQWMTQPGPAYWLKHYRNESQAALFPAAVCRELRGWLDDAQRVAPDQNVRRRVALVSDAFGVTERFVALQEARDRLNRDAMGGAPSVGSGTEEAVSRGPVREERDWRTLATKLETFLEAGWEFVRYTRELKASVPLAVADFNGEDYLRHDPVSNALLTLRERAQAHGEEARANTWLETRCWPPAEQESLAALWAADLAGGRELVRDGAFAGVVRPAQNIAGLDYGVALPAAWLSTVEPAEFQQAVLLEAAAAPAGEKTAPRSSVDGSPMVGRIIPNPPKAERRVKDNAPYPQDSADNETRPESEKRNAGETEMKGAPRVLRLSGNKETSLYQWNAAEAGLLHVAQVRVRGRVSPSCVVSLTLGWLNEQQQRVALNILRLPEGDWPDWVTLRLAVRAPVDARWVGIGVRVQNQGRDDWAEVTDFHLRSH